MSNVKRWHSAYPGSMFEHQAGEYSDEFVSGSDYDALAARLAEADAHGKAQQRWAHEWRDKHDALTAENAALREERALIIQRAENAEAAFEGSCDMNKMILERLAAADALLAEVQSKVFIGCDLVARIDAHLARQP